MKPYQHLSLLLTLILGSGQTAFAQTAPNGISGEQTYVASGDIQSYPASYFASFAPLNAYEMLLRVPGFSVQFADAKRGLGQGGANILLNGVRLTGKGNDPSEQLGRISAGNVVRLELIDGAASGVPGLSGRVANIITRSSSLTGSWSWSPIFRNGVEPNWGRANLSASGSIKKLDYAFSLKNTSNRLGSRGPEFRRDERSELFETAREQFNGVASGPTLSGTLNWKPRTDVMANLEFEYSDFNINEREISRISPNETLGDGRQSLFFFGLDRRQGEISTNVSWPMGKGQVKLIGFYSSVEDGETSLSRTNTVNNQFDGSRFELDVQQTEAILRGEYDWSVSTKRSWQIAAEYAQNELRTNTALFSQTADGILSSINLPDPRTNVIEDRYEVTVTHNWNMSNHWDLQTAIGAEYSELAQLGTASDIRRTFTRPKGFLTLTRTIGESLSLNAKIEREVGQLNFFDFTSSVSLEDDIGQTGNPDLVPQQTWRAEVEANKNFRDGHALQFKVFAEDITDLVDRIPIGEFGDGIGNIDSAKRWGASLFSTLKGEPWGLGGVELSLDLELADSQLTDPIEDFTRSLNNDSEVYYKLAFTHDIPNSPWAYGADISQTYWSPIYRVQSIDENYRSPFAAAYIEHKDVFGLKVRATIFNASDFSIELDRQRFTGRRDQGTLLRTETRSRTFDPYLQFDISGTF